MSMLQITQFGPFNLQHLHFLKHLEVDQTSKFEKLTYILEFLYAVIIS